MLMINNKSRIFILWVTAMIATIGLTGCVKAEISVDVKQNGSGTLSMAIGVTQQAKALASNQGSDPIQEMKKAFAERTGEAQDVKVTTWIDGDYEWAKAEKEFANLDEINNVFTENKAFNKFFLARNRSLFRDEFIIDAEFAPLDGGSAAGNDFGVDPSTVFQLSFSLRLPGQIIETNGLRDKNDPNRIVWDVESKQAVSIKARSMSWNWINIFIIAGLFLLFGVVALGGVGYFVYARSKKNKKVEPVEVEPPKQQAPPLIAEPKKSPANKQLYTLAVVIIFSCSGLLFAARAYQTSQATRSTSTPTPEKISTGANSVVFSTHTAEPSDTLRPTSTITDTATSPPSETPTITVEPATQTAIAVNQVARPLLKNDFSNSTNGWGTGTDADSAIEYANNALQMIVYTKNYFVWSTPDDQDYQNVHMEVTVINNNTDSTTAFGLMCHQQVTDSGYYFAITPAGEYAIAISTLAQQSDVFLTNNDEWAPSDLITKNASSYRVGADCGNGNLTLYVDGQQIASVSDSTYTSGGVALFTWSGENATTTNVSFDDFLMTELQ